MAPGSPSTIPQAAPAVLGRVLAVLLRHTPGLDASLDAAADAWVCTFTRGAAPVRVRITPRSTQPAWARTPSLSVAIAVGSTVRNLDPEMEQLLGTFVALLRHVDGGDLRLDLPPTAPDPPAPEPVPPPLAASREHAEALRWGAFVAHMALLTEDLYPHVLGLGEPTPQDELARGWAATSARMAAGTAPQKLGLYVHVPFCTVACTFCYCAKTDAFRRSDVGSYVERLRTQAHQSAPWLRGRAFTSAYFGGGTPSLLPAPVMRELFQTLYACFDVPAGTQVVFEGNPDSLDPGKVRVLGEVGRVTRLTIGVQTLDDAVQARVRRHNRPEQVEAAVRAARAVGIPHVNIDLMAGLPGQDLASFQRDVRRILALEPDSVHLNGYRPLPRTLAAEDVAAPNADHVARREEMLDWGEEVLAASGHVRVVGQSAHRTHNAANIQEYDLRRQNSSLLGLGYPARSHSYASHYYSPAVAPAFRVDLAAHLAGASDWLAVPADDVEEAHKYLVTNAHMGFDLAEFEALFGGHPARYAPDGVAALVELGLWRIEGARVRVYGQDKTDRLIARSLLYSPALRRRIAQRWEPLYQAGRDYAADVRRLVGTGAG